MGIWLCVLGVGEHKGRGAIQVKWWLPYAVSISEYSICDRSLVVTGVQRGQGTLCCPVLHCFQLVNTPAPVLLQLLLDWYIYSTPGSGNFTGDILASITADAPPSLTFDCNDKMFSLHSVLCQVTLQQS